MLKKYKIGFMGAGNMAQAMIKGLVETSTALPSTIWATNRSEGKLQKVTDAYGIQPLATNEELIDKCEIIFLAMKPQDLTQAIEPIASSFHDQHLVISMAAGFSLNSLRKLMPQVTGLARVMPNTPINIQKAVIGYCLSSKSAIYEPLLRELLGGLGLLVPVDEGEAFEALTVSCASGTGFVYEMMLYWQEWIEERGFDPETARAMVVQTFLGAAEMASRFDRMTLSELQERVTSKKGVTAAGLNSMRELEIERALRYSFEKAALRDQEIAKTTSKS